MEITYCEGSYVPCVDRLLDAAHRNYDVLQKRTEVLLRSGISMDHLPENATLMAFALLGEHDRKVVEEELIKHWQVLVAKGLAKGSIVDISTPELRLLAHARPFTDALDDVWQRLMSETDVSDAVPGILRCSSRIHGYWGQQTNIYFEAEGVDYALIKPDDVFALQPAMVAAEPTGKLVGSFSCHIDDGAITFRLMHRSGEIFKHVIRCEIKGAEA